MRRPRLDSSRARMGGATWGRWDLPQDTAYLAIAPEGTIYLVTAIGLFKSADRGGTWSVVTNSGLTSSISALAVDPKNPNHLFAGTNGGGVFEITLVEE